jgi:SAM-dependent methyltransferase
MKLCMACSHPFADAGWTCPACGSSPARVGGHLAFSPELAVSGSGFHAESFAKLARIEERNFWFRARNRLLVWAMRRYFPKAQSLLEIGCGNGYVLLGMRRAFPRLTLAGSEIFSTGLEFAAARLPGVDLFQMDATHIPFMDEFDVVGAFDVLEHIKDDELVMAQMYQAVRPGGGILVTVPQHMALWSQADVEAVHQRRYSATEMRTKLEHAGFEVVRTTSFVSLLFPLIAAQRRTKRKPNPNYSVHDELAIGGLANWSLERVLGVERALIKPGVSFPFGGSLLAVARKSAEAVKRS